MKCYFTKQDRKEIHHSQWREGEINTKPSKTRPNESYTMSEIVTRSQMGLPLSVKTFVPAYYGEEMPNLRKLDISEAKAIIEENKRKIDEVNKTVQARKAAAQNLRLTEQIRNQIKIEEDEKSQLAKLQAKYADKKPNESGVDL